MGNRFGIEPEVIARLAPQVIAFTKSVFPTGGRTYAEGKKISWKDGFRAVYAIFKYNLEARRH